MDEPLSEDYRFFGTEPGARDGRDGRGQKRLHGAFTGGFIAGYDNTCGSALSWQPSQERRRKQSIEDFMDDDELEEYNKTVLSAKQQYDTFGLAARDTMARELERVEGQAPGNLLVVPSIMVAPVAQGIGVRLLLRMGWRQGKGLDFDRNEEMVRLMEHAKSLRDLGEEARKVLRVDDTRLEPMPTPKSDSFGLGFDPYMGEFEELRRKKKSQSQGQGQSSRGRGPGIAFGTGVVDDEDDTGILEDYVQRDAMAITDVRGDDLLDAIGRPKLRHQGPGPDRLGDRLLLGGYTFEIQDVEDDEGPILLGGRESLPMLSARAHVDRGLHVRAHGPAGAVGRGPCASILPGFVVADDDVLPLVYPRPQIERNFVPRVPTWINHRSSLSVPKSSSKPAREPPPGPLKLRIDQVALQVARSGADFEALATASDSFVAPGDEYHEYYVWKVHRYGEMMRRGQEGAEVTAGPKATRTGTRPQLAIEERSRILGEKQLEEDRKKMEAMMASKFVPAGGNQAPVVPEVTIIDMSKRPPAVRTTEAWVPEPLLRKRLDIQREDGREDDASKKGAGERKRNKRESGQEEMASRPYPAEEEADARLAAEAFLDSLLAETPMDGDALGDGRENDTRRGNGHGDTDGALPVARPLDLFQAIFEDEDEGLGMTDTERDSRVASDAQQTRAPEDLFKPIPLQYGVSRDEPARRAHHHGMTAMCEDARVHSDSRAETPRPRLPPHPPATTNQPPTERADLDDERIRKALRVLEKEKRRKERRAERKREKREKRENREGKSKTTVVPRKMA